MRALSPLSGFVHVLGVVKIVRAMEFAITACGACRG